MFLKAITPLGKCQLKFASEKEGIFEGYASVFNSIDKVNDTIAPGAFAQTLASEQVVKMFVNHQQHEIPVGDWQDMREDDYGLKAVGVIDMNHKDGPSIYSALKRGAMDGLSIGFTMSEGDFETKGEGGRLIKNMNLMETSIVSFPCEGRALITAVKSDILGLRSLKDLENFLRDVGGFSASMAKVFVSQVKSVTRDEWGDEQIAMRVLRDEQINSLLNTVGGFKL